MKIEKINKKKNNLYELLFEDLTKIELYDDTLIKYNLLTKKEIDNKLFTEISTYNQNLSSYYAAIKYISIKLRTKSEIEKKLTLLKYSKESINYTIERLNKEGYLNNSIYIKSFINDQILLTLNGPKKIISLLEKLGFNNNEINNGIEQVSDEVWLDKIDKIIEKRIKSNHNLSRKMLIVKIKKDLMNLGYNSNWVNNKLEILDIPEDLNILNKEIRKEYKKLSKKYEDKILINKIKYNLYKKGFIIDNIDDIIKENV